MKHCANLLLLVSAFALMPSAAPAQLLGNEMTYGGVTNCICGGVTVHQGPGPNRALVISVFVTNSSPIPHFQQEEYGTNWLRPFLEKVSNNDWLYYMPTNSFCGPVELRDAHGEEVPSLKPELSEPDAYPARYSLSAENENYFRRYQAYRGPGSFPLPLLGVRSFSEMAKLSLAEYFDVKERGEYRFTVWPKMYKRMAKTNDLCERVDLPPVTVTVKW
jgi:hypothetical protein